MAKAKRSGDRAHRGAAEALCEAICREYRNKDKFNAIKAESDSTAAAEATDASKAEAAAPGAGPKEGEAAKTEKS